MGHNRFIASRTFTVEELGQLHALARRSLPGFADRAANDLCAPRSRDLATLSLLPSSPPLAISAVTVTGVLAPLSAVWEQLADIVSRATTVSSLGRLDIGCAFEERSSEQDNAEDADWVHIAESRAGLFFGYRAGASRVARDAAYRRDFMRRMLDELSLPLTVEDAPDGMRLQSDREAQLQITPSRVGDREPDGFSCEMRQSSLTAELARMKRGVDRFSSGTIFAYLRHCMPLSRRSTMCCARRH